MHHYTNSQILDISGGQRYSSSDAFSPQRIRGYLFRGQRYAIYKFTFYLLTHLLNETTAATEAAKWKESWVDAAAEGNDWRGRNWLDWQIHRLRMMDESLAVTAFNSGLTASILRCLSTRILAIQTTLESSEFTHAVRFHHHHHLNYVISQRRTSRHRSWELSQQLQMLHIRTVQSRESRSFEPRIRRLSRRNIFRILRKSIFDCV